MEVIKYFALAIMGLTGLAITVSTLTKVIAKTIYEEKFNFLTQISENNKHFNTSNNKKRGDSK